jgi:hypothetical protein
LADNNDDHVIPETAAGYRPILGDEYKSLNLDLADPRWKQATEDAHAGKLSHAAFKIMLNREAKRVMDAHVEKTRTPAKAAETPDAAPAKAAPEVPLRGNEHVSQAREIRARLTTANRQPGTPHASPCQPPTYDTADAR